jgi:hypothetical protein
MMGDDASYVLSGVLQDCNLNERPQCEKRGKIRDALKQ